MQTKSKCLRSRYRKEKKKEDAIKMHYNWLAIGMGWMLFIYARFPMNSLIFSHWNAIASIGALKPKIYINWDDSHGKYKSKANHFNVMQRGNACAAVAPGKWLSENECLKVHILIEHEVFFFCSAFCCSSSSYKRNSQMHLRTRKKLFRFTLLTSMHSVRKRRTNGKQQPAERGKNIS